jgi:hypothetical protein
MSINEIQQLCASDSIRWTDHAVKRLIQRDITRPEVKFVLSNGEIIEQYPDDYPYPSCLVLGITNERRYLHIVCGIGGGELWIVSAYCPDTDKWEDDLRTRKEV